MFFVKELSHTILLPPAYFGPRMHEYLKSRVLADVEGTCSGRYGYIVTVLDVNTSGKGKVLPGTGSAEFNVQYSAVLFKPFKGEVMDALVSTVNKMGFFADAGPLQVFVSSHLIPPELRFDPNITPPAYTSDDMTIAKGTQVRIKVVGTRVDATEIFAIGSIKEDYLGAITD